MAYQANLQLSRNFVSAGDGADPPNWWNGGAEQIIISGCAIRNLTNISMRTTIDNEKKYAKLDKRILTEFRSFVEKANDQAILELVKQ